MKDAAGGLGGGLRLAVVAALQLAVMLGWGGHHEWVRTTAPTFRIPLRPVDPFDPLRGRYFVLNPADATVTIGPRLPADEVRRFLGDRSGHWDDAFVGFCPEPGTPVHRVCGLRRVEEGLPEDDRRWVRAGVSVSSAADGATVSVVLGLERFFLPNRVQLPAAERADGWSLEVSHRPGARLLARRLWFRETPVG